MTNQYKRRQYLKAIGVSAVSLSAASSAKAAPSEVVVPDDESTIQAGVDAVASGGAVRVKQRSSPYTGEVKVGKPVTIVGDAGGSDPGAGQNAPVVDGGGAGEQSGFSLYKQGSSPDDVTIRGFEIRNFGTRPRPGEWGHGVSAGRENERITVQDCTFSNVGAAGISVSTWGDRSYNDWTVERCRFDNAPLAGVRFDHVSNVNIRDNEFRNPSPITDDYPHFGAYIHANTRSGQSGTQSGVTIEENRFVGDSDRAAVYLLAINKNDPASNTVAALDDVKVAENEFTEMPNSVAVVGAVNPVQGAETRIRNLEVHGNVVQDAHAGIVIDSAAEDGLAGVKISNNDINAQQSAVQVSGKAPAAIVDVLSKDNTYTAADHAVKVTPDNETESANGDTRYAVDNVRFVGDEANGGNRPGIVVQTDRVHGIGSVELEDTSASGINGLFVGGHSPDAIESVSVAGGNFKGTNARGIVVRGLPAADKQGSEPLVGSASFSGVSITGEGGLGIVGHTPNAVGSVEVNDLDVDVTGGPGLEIRSASDGDQSGSKPAVGPVSVENAAIAIGRGAAVRVKGTVPGGLTGVDLANLVVDATAAMQGGAGVVVRGEAPDATGPVTVDDATLRTRGPGILVETGEGENAAVQLSASNATVESEESVGIAIDGREPGAVKQIELDAIKVDSQSNTVQIDGQAPGSIGEIVLDNADLRSQAQALVVNGRADDAIESVSVTDLVAQAENFITATLAGHGSNAIESVTAEGLKLNGGGVGLLCFAEQTDGISQIDVSGSEFHENEYGIALSGHLLGDALRVHETNFVNNEKSPESESVGYGLANFSQTGGMVDAKRNYWGHPSGPARPHPSKSKGNGASKGQSGDPETGGEFRKRQGPPETLGKGDRITEGVAFRPWLKQSV